MIYTACVIEVALKQRVWNLSRIKDTGLGNGEVWVWTLWVGGDLSG